MPLSNSKLFKDKGVYKSMQQPRKRSRRRRWVPYAIIGLVTTGFIGLGTWFSTRDKEIYGNLWGKEEYRVYNVKTGESEDIIAHYVQATDGMIYKVETRKDKIPKEIEKFLVPGGAQPAFRFKTRKDGVKKVPDKFPGRWQMGSTKLNGELADRWYIINPGNWKNHEIKIQCWNKGEQPYNTIVEILHNGETVVKYVAWGPEGRKKMKKTFKRLKKAKQNGLKTVFSKYTHGEPIIDP